MTGINWEQLCRNGQLVHTVPEHRAFLDRFDAFFKGTADEDMMHRLYPDYYKAKEAVQEEKVEDLQVEAPAVAVQEEKPRKRRRSTS